MMTKVLFHCVPHTLILFKTSVIQALKLALTQQGEIILLPKWLLASREETWSFLRTLARIPPSNTSFEHLCFHKHAGIEHFSHKRLYSAWRNASFSPYCCSKSYTLKKKNLEHVQNQMSSSKKLLKNFNGRIRPLFWRIIFQEQLDLYRSCKCLRPELTLDFWLQNIMSSYCTATRRA